MPDLKQIIRLDQSELKCPMVSDSVHVCLV